jgi:hypothetical protein
MVEKCVCVFYYKCVCVFLQVRVCVLLQVCVCVLLQVCVCVYTIAARRKRSMTHGTVFACMYVYVFR